MKLSHRLIIVESVNTQWMIFFLEINLWGQLTDAPKWQMCRWWLYEFEHLRAKLSAQESEPRQKQELWEDIPLSFSPPGSATLSKVGSTEQFFKVRTADITVLTLKKRH